MISLRRLAGFFLVVMTIPAHAGNLGDRHYFSTPGINFGYTFGAGITYGLTLDLGVQKDAEMLDRYGIALSYSYVHTKKYVHHIRTFSFMAENDFAKVSAGWGRVSNKWGYRNHNKCRTHGLAFDAAFAYPSVLSPWIGVKTFRYHYASWAWFSQPYNSIYTAYRYNVMEATAVQQHLSSKP